MERKIVTSKEFHRNKRRLIELERRNYDKIIMLPRTGVKGKDRQWYEIADHSALIYYYEVCEVLGEMAKFGNDVDSYYDRYEIGLICMNGSNKLRLLVQKAGLYGKEEDVDGYRVIHLKKKFTAAHLKELKRKERQRRKENNEIIKVDFVDPELYIWLRETAENLHRVCNNHFTKLAMWTNGQRMVILADKILNNYQKLSMVPKDKGETKLVFWQGIYRDTKDLTYEIQTALAVKVMSSADGAAVCERLRKALKKIKLYHNNLAKEIREKNATGKSR